MHVRHDGGCPKCPEEYHQCRQSEKPAPEWRTKGANGQLSFIFLGRHFVGVLFFFTASAWLDASSRATQSVPSREISCSTRSTKTAFLSGTSLYGPTRAVCH